MNGDSESSRGEFGERAIVTAIRALRRLPDPTPSWFSSPKFWKNVGKEIYTMRNDLDRTTRTANTNLIESNRVEGTEVFDPAGKHIGAIKRLVIDKQSGRVVYTVASFGGFLGMGGDEYTIPWNKLRYDPSLGGYQTDITEAQLKASPDFGRNGNDDWYERENERTLNDYYGSQYYWSS